MSQDMCGTAKTEILGLESARETQAKILASGMRSTEKISTKWVTELRVLITEPEVWSSLQKKRAIITAILNNLPVSNG